MILKRIASVVAITLLLITCTSCQTENLDLNGDGEVTRSEFLSAVFDALCGDSTNGDGSADEPTEGDETDNGSEDAGTTGD